MKTLVWFIILGIISVVAFYVVMGLVGGALGTALSMAVPFVLGYALGRIKRVPKVEQSHIQPVGPS